MITGADLPLSSIHRVLHRRPSPQRSFSRLLLAEGEAVEAEAIGVEAVDELAASTSLVPTANDGEHLSALIIFKFSQILLTPLEY